MLAELSRREKAANIKPDPDIDVYMKVRSFFEFEASPFEIESIQCPLEFICLLPIG